jgi:glycosyltransferase involved in cell wall biosynthesis
MNKVRTVLFSNFSLPFSGIASWTTMINFHLYNECNIDYIVSPESDIIVENPKQYIVQPLTIYNKIQSKFFGVSKHKNFLEKLDEILSKEEKLIVQIIDNAGLIFALIEFLEKKRLKKRVYLQFFFHGYQPFPKSELMCSKIDELILLSKKSYFKFRDNLNVIPTKVSILNNGVDSLKFNALDNLGKKVLKEKLNLRKDTIYFTWCSQDRKKKGLEMILHAWEKLVKITTHKIALLVIGTDKSIELDCVKVLGKIPNNKLNQFLQVSDFYLFTTLCQEGFGLSLVEALKCGNYCIASNMGAVSEVLADGRYGRLIDFPNSSESWINVILESLDEYVNNDLKNPYFKNIPKDLFDIVYWNNGLNKIIKEAKDSFNKRYYI